MSIPADLPEIPQRELRNEISRVLREVKAGHAYTITVDGSPIADLIPHRDTRRRVAVPRAEFLETFAGLPYSGSQWQEEADRFVDDSLYDPYDRAYRRGEFAEKVDE
jgi:prevent-host-death family protein